MTLHCAGDAHHLLGTEYRFLTLIVIEKRLWKELEIVWKELEILWKKLEILWKKLEKSLKKVGNFQQKYR